MSVTRDLADHEPNDDGDLELIAGDDGQLVMYDPEDFLGRWIESPEEMLVEVRWR